ncbi:MAG: YadA-like family protein, partial [Selenomonadales bacterium]|nr:YadA-like family protein [Selenomonadales bacterium]
AGAAALAALHPLDYDAENKLSFAAGLGNYGGATAAAVGAFYRPNQNMMFSIGGTAGNGENMFNVGASFAIGKGSSGVAKLSKAELVQVVKDVKAENSELRHEINNAKADNQKLQERIAKLEEMVLKLAGK